MGGTHQPRVPGQEYVDVRPRSRVAPTVTCAPSAEDELKAHIARTKLAHIAQDTVIFRHEIPGAKAPLQASAPIQGMPAAIMHRLQPRYAGPAAACPQHRHQYQHRKRKVHRKRRNQSNSRSGMKPSPRLPPASHPLQQQEIIKRCSAGGGVQEVRPSAFVVAQEALCTDEAAVAAKLAAMQRELGHSQALLGELKALAANESAVQSVRLKADFQRAAVEAEASSISRRAGQMRNKDLQSESLQQQVLRLESELEISQRATASTQTGTNLAASRKEAEAAKAELQALKTQLQAERSRTTKNVEALKARTVKAQKTQHAAEVAAAAEARTKFEAEKGNVRLEVALAQQVLETGKREVERLDNELRDNRTRTQELLKAKDVEIKTGRDAAAVAPVISSALAARRSQLVTAEAARTTAKEALIEVVERLMAEERPSMETQDESFQVFVRLITGRTAMVHITSSDTVRDVLLKTSVKDGVPADLQRLLHSGRQLDPFCTVAHYGIQQHATLHLSARVRGGMPGTMEFQEFQAGVQGAMGDMAHGMTDAQFEELSHATESNLALVKHVKRSALPSWSDARYDALMSVYPKGEQDQNFKQDVYRRLDVLDDQVAKRLRSSEPGTTTSYEQFYTSQSLLTKQFCTVPGYDIKFEGTIKEVDLPASDAAENSTMLPGFMNAIAKVLGVQWLKSSRSLTLKHCVLFDSHDNMYLHGCAPDITVVPPGVPLAPFNGVATFELQKGPLNNKHRGKAIKYCESLLSANPVRPFSLCFLTNMATLEVFQSTRQANGRFATCSYSAVNMQRGEGWPYILALLQQNSIGALGYHVKMVQIDSKQVPTTEFLGGNRNSQVFGIGNSQVVKFFNQGRDAAMAAESVALRKIQQQSHSALPVLKHEDIVQRILVTSPRIEPSNLMQRSVKWSELHTYCSAIAHLHSQCKMVHRDIEPKHLGVNPSCIIDMGCCMSLEAGPGEDQQGSAPRDHYSGTLIYASEDVHAALSRGESCPPHVRQDWVALVKSVYVLTHLVVREAISDLVGKVQKCSTIGDAVTAVTDFWSSELNSTTPAGSVWRSLIEQAEHVMDARHASYEAAWTALSREIAKCLRAKE